MQNNTIKKLMSNKKQTSIEWLESEMLKPNLSMKDIFNQAKEMDKQQKIDAYNQGRHNGQVNWGVGNDITAEQYYKETYGETN